MKPNIFHNFKNGKKHIVVVLKWLYLKKIVTSSCLIAKMEQKTDGIQKKLKKILNEKKLEI